MKTSQRMRMKTNVYEEALKRIERLFNEFPNVVVAFSGGKDSTAVLNLSLEVAEKLDKLPLKVMWIDQEAEWQGTVDYCERIFEDSRIEPLWFQMPLKWYNNVSTEKEYIYIWEEGKEWMRPKSDISIKENTYLDFGFHDLFNAIIKNHFPDEPACIIGGMRAEEAPKRLTAMTASLTYKDITWGKVLTQSKDHYAFHPIYDWSYSDVWKYIHDNRFDYNEVYDKMYQYGVQVKDMRVSNLHHETALQNILLVQELEPKTWDKLASRIEETGSIKHLKSLSFSAPKDLPYMFESWYDYSNHLAKNLITDDAIKEKLRKRIESQKEYFINTDVVEDYSKTVINTILASDWDFTLIGNFETNANYRTVKKFVNGEITPENLHKNQKYNRYLKGII